ncbi:MAG: HAD family hydrolase [Ignavibacteriae bacterium]|nr:HAD family hydrolase [Ignavibacteriota bacterium]
MIECVVFDLDGTLVNSHENIYKAAVKTLEKLNLSTNVDKEIFYNLLGHHFKVIFDGCNVYVPDVEQFIDEYKKLYFDFIDESSLYKNSKQLLEFLHSKNVKTGLLTTKAQDQAENICAHFGLTKYLDVIEGRKIGIPIKPAPDQFFKICKEVNADPVNSLMVGDTELDILCGKSAGAKTAVVAYGYRKLEELKTYDPDYYINDLIEIKEII